MTHKLVQKHLLKGTQEFELVDDAINIRIKKPFGTETLTVVLSVLNPEPVINKSLVEFTSRVNNEPLVSFWSGKPNSDEFNAFINLIKDKARNEFMAFAGLRGAPAAGLEHNSYDEPPAFEERDDGVHWESREVVLRPADIEASIKLLTEQVGEEPLGAFLEVLKQLKDDPENDQLLKQLVDEFSQLGPLQGAVLSYAPYVIVVLSDDPYGF